jgi:hypothetical protein
MTSSSLVVAALALTACAEPRQLVLSISTTAGVPCDIDRVRVVATAGGKTTIDQTLRGERMPITIALLDDTPDGRFEVDISGYKGGVEVMRTSGPLRFADHAATAPVLLARGCRPEAPCELAEAMAAAAVAPGIPDPGCVADVTRYAASPALDSFTDACMAPDAKRVLVDGSAGPIAIPGIEAELLARDFQFYGRKVGQVWVARDGYVSFAPDNPDPAHALVPGALDRDIRHAGAAPPVQSVMAFWDALALGSAGVCYVIDDTADQRQLLVTWTHACLTTPCVADNLNFTIALEEGTGRVVLTYGTMTAGNMDGARGINATVGLVDDASGCPADECVLATGLCRDGATPCGYSQVFSSTLQVPRLMGQQFTPVAP